MHRYLLLKLNLVWVKYPEARQVTIFPLLIRLRPLRGLPLARRPRFLLSSTVEHFNDASKLLLHLDPMLVLLALKLRHCNIQRYEGLLGT